MSHLINRLPPSYCKYNATELLWAKVKGEVAQISNSLMLYNTKNLINKEITRVTKDFVSCILHAEQ
jgi:hypothetical protein